MTPTPKDALDALTWLGNNASFHLHGDDIKRRVETIRAALEAKANNTPNEAMGPIKSITLGPRYQGAITEQEAVDLVNEVIKSQLEVARAVANEAATKPFDADILCDQHQLNMLYEKRRAALEAKAKPVDVDATVSDIIAHTSIPESFTARKYLREVASYLTSRGIGVSYDEAMGHDWVEQKSLYDALVLNEVYHEALNDVHHIVGKALDGRKVSND